MQAFLEALVPRIAPGLQFLCVPFEGKADLRRNAARRLHAWREPGAKFLLLVDQDQDDCRRLKQELVASVPVRDRDSAVVVRIVCRCLESWLLSDLDGLREAMPHALPASSRVEKFRDPDSLANATQEVERLLGQAPLRKVQTAREIGRVLLPARVTSRSLQTFIASVTRCSEEPANV